MKEDTLRQPLACAHLGMGKLTHTQMCTHMNIPHDHKQANHNRGPNTILQPSLSLSADTMWQAPTTMTDYFFSLPKLIREVAISR